jgi:hypothetical protein
MMSEAPMPLIRLEVEQLKYSMITALDTAIKEEVRNFFWNGDGRSAVAASVRESLLKRETYTVLDDVEGK